MPIELDTVLTAAAFATLWNIAKTEEEQAAVFRLADSTNAEDLHSGLHYLERSCPAAGRLVNALVRRPRHGLVS